MELEGKVEEPKFLRSLVEMGRDRFTGAVRLEREDLIKILYLQEGDIISASTNDPAESVDEILLRAKKVTREHIQQALVKRKMDETLGDTLLASGFITRKELRWARRHQIISVLRSAITESEWHYTVVPDYVSSRSSEGTRFAVESLLIELVVTDPDRDRVERRLVGGEVRLRKAPNFDDRYPSLGLNEDADRVTALVNGTRTAAEIAADAGGNGFMNLKLLAALQLLNVLEVNPKAQEQLEISFEHEAGAGELLPGITPGVPAAIPQWEVESFPGAAEHDADLPIEPHLTSWETGDEATTDSPASDDDFVDSGIPRPDEMAEETADLLEPRPQIDSLDEPDVDDSLEVRPGSESPPVLSETPIAADVAPERGKSTNRSLLAAAGLLVGVLVLGFLLWPFMVEPEPEPESSSLGAPPAEVRTPVAAVPGATTVVPDEADDTAVEVNLPADPVAPGDTQSAETTVQGAPGNAEGSSDELRARYDTLAREDEEEAASVPYTVQFEIVCQTSSVTLALEEGGASVWYVPISYQGRPCYRVFWGRYESEAAAAAAFAEIPATLRGGRPVVVRPGRVIQ